MELTNILIVEDDTDINNLLARIMKQQGFQATQAFSGTEARLRLSMEEYDLMLLDLMLPGVMGEDIIQEIREKSDLPILVLSAKSALEDRVKVLNLGADDYLIKPFEKEEVIARVNRALRRYKGYAKRGGKKESRLQEESLTYKKLTLHTQAREALVNSQPLSLTAHEYDILLLLMQNPNKVYSRESLYEEIWKGGYYGEDNTVNVHVSNLRKKIAALDEEEYIKTVWGIGFKLV